MKTSALNTVHNQTGSDSDDDLRPMFPHMKLPPSNQLTLEAILDEHFPRFPTGGPLKVPLSPSDDGLTTADYVINCTPCGVTHDDEVQQPSVQNLGAPVVLRLLRGPARVGP
jgi:hypothetical protein